MTINGIETEVTQFWSKEMTSWWKNWISRKCDLAINFWTVYKWKEMYIKSCFHVWIYIYIYSWRNIAYMQYRSLFLQWKMLSIIIVILTQFTEYFILQVMLRKCVTNSTPFGPLVTVYTLIQQRIVRTITFNSQRVWQQLFMGISICALDLTWVELMISTRLEEVLQARVTSDCQIMVLGTLFRMFMLVKNTNNHSLCSHLLEIDHSLTGGVSHDSTVISHWQVQ